MKNIKNIFGEGVIYDETDLKGKVYATSAACMSVWSDFLSWANANKDQITNSLNEANTIVVLGCQVTDLAVLNDIKTAERLHNLTKKDIFMGGCLAQRFDIELPSYVKRLDVVRVIGQPLYDRTLVHYEKPFWVKDFKESNDTLAEGNLFRNFYPLKIGAGCHGKCKYCTIRHTRGNTYETITKEQIEEFLTFENIVLISDSPTVQQIKDWCNIAKKYNKEISIRNIEPQTLVLCQKEVEEIAKLGLLKILHCPIQSFDVDVLKIMNRSVSATQEALKVIEKVRSYGTLVATNVIIDYVDGNKTYSNNNTELLNKTFDYWSWNPYFDGKWSFEKAEQRLAKYIINN